MNSNGRKGEHRVRTAASFLCSRGNQAGEAFAAAGVGDLVVILNEADELLSRPILRRAAVVAPAIARVFPVEDKSVADGFSEIGERTEIHQESLPALR